MNSLHFNSSCRALAANGRGATGFEMNRIMNFMAGCIVGAVGLYGAMTYHLVRAEDGFHTIPKVSNGLSDAYVDIREFTTSDWTEHRALVAALVKADRGDLMKDSALYGLKSTARSVLESLGID